MIIGQEHFRNTVSTLINDNKLARFVILTGTKGSGKKTLANWMADQLGGQKYVVSDLKVDTIRDMIAMAYKQRTKTVVIIPDADGMSLAAKNAILKVTEEPPNNVYFIMTLEGLHNTLDTIKSRATTYSLDNYSQLELSQYIDGLKGVKPEEQKLLLHIGNNPGEIQTLKQAGVTEFYEYVEKVVDNIAKVSGANAFKIADKVAIKTDAEGYDLTLFLHIFMQICLTRLADEGYKDYWRDGIDATYQALLDLRIKGVNRQFLIDRWILEVRRAWM